MGHVADPAPAAAPEWTESAATTVRPTVPTLVRSGVVTVVAAVVATVAASLVLRAVLGIDPSFQPIGPGSVAFITALQVGIGMIVYGVIARRASRPRRTWLIVAIVALVLSFVPDIGLLANPGSTPFAGVTSTAVVGLMVLHVVAAFVAILLPLRLAPVADPA